MSDPQPGPGSLTERVQGLLNSVLAVVKGAGRDDLDRDLRETAARWGEGEVTVVVAGEAKRGKSSLVNALLASPGLSPVDEELCTTVHVVVRHAAAPGARVHFEDGRPPRDVAAADAPVWVTLRDNPGNTKGVRAVEIGLDHPLLARHLVLVDTPGVGGLEAAHAEITLAALGGADALVFVMDAGAPLSGPELSFLARAAQRIDAVVLVMTQTDLFYGWREIRDADRDLLKQRAPRFARCPFVAVSNRVKDKADEVAAAGDAALAGELLAESGFPELEAVLGEGVLGRGRLLRQGNLVQAMRAALASIELGQRAALADPGQGVGLAEALAAVQGEYEQFTRAGKLGNTDWNYEWQHLDALLNRELGRLLDEISTRYAARIATADRPGLDALPSDLDADLRGLAARLELVLQGEVAAMLGRIGVAFGVGAFDPAADPLELQPVLGAAEMPASGAAPEANPWLRMRSAVMGGASFASIAGLVGGPLVLGAVAGILVGGLSEYFGGRQKAALVDRQRAQQYTRDTVARARSAVTNELRRTIVVLKQDLERRVAAARERRERELKDALAEQQRLAAADKVTREKDRAAGRERLQRTSELEKAADALLADVHRAAAGLSAPGGPRRETT